MSNMVSSAKYTGQNNENKSQDILIRITTNRSVQTCGRSVNLYNDGLEVFHRTSFSSEIKSKYSRKLYKAPRILEGREMKKRKF